MDHFNRVRSEFDDLPYMRHPQATLIRDIIVEHDAQDILKIGFLHGKSSAYLAAILEDLGRGHLVTIDRNAARQREPNIERVLSALDLTHRVTPVYAERSYTREMAKMIRAKPRTAIRPVLFRRRPHVGRNGFWIRARRFAASAGRMDRLR